MRKSILFLIGALCISSFMHAQIITSEEVVPKGSIIYSLPMTVVNLKVTAEYENFQVGPYAAYAKKFLGIDAKQKSGNSFKIKSILMTPLIEADPRVSAIINLNNSKKATANFLNFCNQGLVVVADDSNKPSGWRAENVVADNAFLSGITSNTQDVTSTLYKSVETENGVERVPVKQTHVVEKSLEKKAEETAEMIFRLRNKRIDIVTGDTDATFSGEAMGATLNEISKLEEELLSMFLGKSVKGEQVVSFDVIPVADGEKQMYIAFRLSETEGLLPASNMQGRPFVLELNTEDENAQIASSEASKGGKGLIVYRKPLMVTAKLIDGSKLLLQSRIPVYQLGKTLTFPIDAAIR